MHFALNELDESTNYFKLFNLEEANKNLATNKNCHGTAIFATSQALFDKDKHTNCIKNEDWQLSEDQSAINPFTIPIEAAETKSPRMPLPDYPRHNYNTVLLPPPYDPLNYKWNRKRHQMPEWVPRLSEIVRVLDKEYDKTNFAFPIPLGFS